MLYVHKPTVVRAEPFFYTKIDSYKRYLDHEELRAHSVVQEAIIEQKLYERDGGFYIKPYNNEIIVNDGDYIVLNESGQFYKVRKEDFDDLYYLDRFGKIQIDKIRQHEEQRTQKIKYNKNKMPPKEETNCTCGCVCNNTQQTVIISQPMRGKPEEQVRAERAELEKELADQDYKVVDTVFPNFTDEGNVPLKYLAKSLEFIAEVDAVYFMDGWQDARGCRIEHSACVDYGIKILCD